jgi:dipeptidyl aminopeptidase/acylaminoacyl peptidase
VNLACVSSTRLLDGCALARRGGAVRAQFARRRNMGGRLHAYVPLALSRGFLVAPVSANAAFPGENGLIAWNTASNAGPGVRAGMLDGRAKRRIGLLATSPPTAAEQSGRPRWSPSGKRLAYLNLGESRIEIRSPRGRLLRRVTTPGLWDPAWSPDGRELITAALASPDHALVRRDGSGAERLTQGEEPVWSPDGRRIAFIRGADVYTMRADGSAVRRVMRSRVRNTDIRGVAWSPDGRRIAFAADLFEPEPTLEYHIATVGANGGPVRVHWKSRGFISALDWQPR